MKVNVEMGSDIFYELVEEAVKKAVETTKKELRRLEYYTEEEAMEILGYKSKLNFKRNIRNKNVNYRRIGNKMFIHVDELNRFIDKYGRVDQSDRKHKVL